MRQAFHTLYTALRGPRRREINSGLGVLSTSFVQFLERGFDDYLQHFVMMVIRSSRLSLKYFEFANLGASHLLLFYSEQLLMKFAFLRSTISGLAEEGKIESHRRPPTDPAEANKTLL